MDDATLFEELNLGELTGASATPAPAGESPYLEHIDTTETGEPEGEGEADAGTDEEAAGTDESGTGEGDQPADTGEAGTEPERPLAAEFSIKQGDTEVEVPRDVSISFIADGEERELPLDRVVRLAQMGYYNEQRANEIREFREALPEIEEQFAGLERERDALLEGWQRVLAGDDEYLDQQREDFVRARSPEARADRLERELEQVRRGQFASRDEQEARAFVQNLAPEFEVIGKEAPEVTFEELIGRFNVLTAPLMVRGQIPKTRFREVERIVRGDLRQWADAQNAKRSSARNTQTQLVKKATAETSAAKRQAARAVLPRGTQTGGAQKQAPKKYESASDILGDIASIVRGE
jgi:hypothetical protein